jgi:hypothetical protein
VTCRALALRRAELCPLFPEHRLALASVGLLVALDLLTMHKLTPKSTEEGRRTLIFVPPHRRSRQRYLEPATPLEPKHRKDSAENNHREAVTISPVPPQLRHKLEIHAIDAGHERRGDANN